MIINMKYKEILCLLSQRSIITARMKKQEIPEYPSNSRDLGFSVLEGGSKQRFETERTVTLSWQKGGHHQEGQFV